MVANRTILFCIFTIALFAGTKGFCNIDNASSKILIGVVKNQPGFELRLKMELQAAGFSVELKEIQTDNDVREHLEQAAKEANAGAALLCLTNTGYVEI
jgi:hypothetical protein